MNCKKFQRFKNLFSSKVLKSLTVVFILSLALFLSFYSPKSFSQTLPDCATISGGVAANPGINCLFYRLPLCSTSRSECTTFDNNPSCNSRRVNCANLIDLPLCRDIDVALNALPEKNCVKECSDPSFASNPDPTHLPPYVRGVDYAVHNRNCIRFCDSVEAGITANPGVNCVTRKCHQVTSTTSPSPPANCRMLPCNLLTPDELNDVKFDDSTKKYCEGATVKCYNFTKKQLPYVRQRVDNTMCLIHNCKPRLQSCVGEVCTPVSSACGPDDTLNITQKDIDNPPASGEESYQAAYVRTIGAGYALSSTEGICVPMVCKPVITQTLRCEPITDDNPTTLNASCNPTSTCVAGYCTQTIDCNLTANEANALCLSTDTDTSTGPVPDSENSWFYRPKPLDKAVDSNGILLSPMQDALCYTKSDLEDHHFGYNDLLFGLFYTNYLGYPARSPGVCNPGHNDGSRGEGINYLCGVGGDIQVRPSDDTVFINGRVGTTFREGSADHAIDVCVRYKNAMVASSREACGSRECGITYGFDKFFGQGCGYDRCRTLTVSESDINAVTGCKMTDDLMSPDSDNGDCMARLAGGALLDSNIRVRAVQYGNRICAFLDVKGQLGYKGIYFNGKEKLTNDTAITTDDVCVAGVKQSDGSCDGVNTNSNKGLAHVWRTNLMVQYIQNNRPSSDSLRGFINKQGVFFKQQECIRVALRIAPPRTYQIATRTNSIRLFTPPLYILKATMGRGRSDSPVPTGQSYGTTDFHYPEIVVKYGSLEQKLSLGIGYTGDETTSPDAAGSKTLNATVGDLSYTAEVFVKKEFNDTNLTPTFCLYRRVRDRFGVEISPVRVACVERRLPEIDNAATVANDPTVTPQKILVYADAANAYNNASIILRYQGKYGANGINNNCATGGDDECSREVKITNPDSSIPTCVTNTTPSDATTKTEQFKICAKREECSDLNMRCVQNEIDMQAAKVRGDALASYQAVKLYCEQTLLPYCNRKKGIVTTSPDATLIASNPSTIAAVDNAYGWFNEICITTGFERKLKRIIAYTTPNAALGKCIVKSDSPYLTDSASLNTNCDNGGKAPNCNCYEAINETDPGAGRVIRTQTPREAGLCVDIPLPKICPAIDFNPNPNSDNSDVDYVTYSLGKTSYNASLTTPYNSSSNVHLSHKYRTEGVTGVDSMLLRGHAEFPAVLFGTNAVEGECRGFWKYKTDISGSIIKPTLNCVNNGATSQPTWSASVPAAQQCERYSCQAVDTSGPDSNGIYQGGYDNGLANVSGAADETKGRNHGYAKWDVRTLTSDFAETYTARACIPGFKAVGSTAVISGGVIMGYSGGTLPVRICTQLGTLLSVVDDAGNSAHICQRITCAEKRPPTPTSSADAAAWNAWADNGGVIRFPEVNASRSDRRDPDGKLIVQPESYSRPTSTAEGCNNALGFFQSSGSPLPSRGCDYLGNWQEVVNPCVTECNATTDFEATQSSNGYAYWDKVTGVSIGGQKDGVFSRCVNSDYKVNPYPPTKDKYGNNLDPAVANDLTRAAGNPQRVCKSVTTAGGAANVWTNPSSFCINKCPGSTTDSRIGVGITAHPAAAGTSMTVNGTSMIGVTVNWPDQDFGTYAYKSSAGCSSAISTTDFNSGRNNGCYVLRRFCGSDGKWSNPEPVCVANGGDFGNAKYDGVATSVEDSASAGSLERIAGVCKANYWQKTRAANNTLTNLASPSIKCSYKNSTNNIDQVFWEFDGSETCNLVTCPSQTIAATTRTASQNISQANVNTVTTIGCIANASLASMTPPSVTCQSSGSWTSTVANQTSCVAGCDVPATSSFTPKLNAWAWSGSSVTLNDDGSGGGASMSWTAFSLQSGQWVSATLLGTDGNGCSSWYFGAVCTDGSLRYTSSYSDSNSTSDAILNDWNLAQDLIDYGDSCMHRTYDPVANNFRPRAVGIWTATNGDRHFEYPNGINFIDKTGATHTFKDYDD